MNPIVPQIELTDDGSQTLRHPLLLECYHSSRGALGEACHVYINAGFYYWCARSRANGEGDLSRFRTKEQIELSCDYEPVLARSNSADDLSCSGVMRIFEMGFGSGLNAWLTAQVAVKMHCRVEYYALERYPVDPRQACRLDYAADGLFRRIHEQPWGVLVELSEWFSLKKIEGSLLDCRFDATFDLVYFDAFAPDVQPELWSEEVFVCLKNAMNLSGVLVSYSAKGDVKRNLRGAGFRVERLPGALGKHHMLRAVVAHDDTKTGPEASVSRDRIARSMINGD